MSRILVAAFGDAGHAFPAIALARELDSRGHDVVVETWEKWREPVGELGIRFEAAEGYKVFPPPDPAGSEGPTAGDAALALRPLFDEFRPELVVSDILTVAPALAAEAAGVARATLVPHLWPVTDPGMPFFAMGMAAPRTIAGRALWRAGHRVLDSGLRRGRDELNAEREKVGLAPLERFHGGISEELAIVGTFPQLEYPRDWPAGAHVVGPLAFETPYPDVELPPGDGPLVLVAPSTAQDREGRLLSASLRALAGEPVRVIATSNHHAGTQDLEVPANAVLVDWLSYTQVMAEAALVVCHGGHGTVARALAAGVPVLVSPAVGDMAETGIRVAWAECGLNLPFRLCRPAPLRWAVRRILGDPGFAARARELAESRYATGGPARAAELIERHLGR